MKFCFLDTETLGLDPLQHDMIQFAAIVEIDGKVVDACNIKMRPKRTDNISAEALMKQNRTLEELMQWPERKEGFKQILKFLSKHVDQFDKSDKMYMVAYNLIFDDNFLRQFFNEFNFKYMNSFFWRERIDVFQIAMFLKMAGAINTPNLKQVTVANFLGINITDEESHDALVDVRCLRKLFYKMEKMYEIVPLKNP